MQFFFYNEYFFLKEREEHTENKKRRGGDNVKMNMYLGCRKKDVGKKEGGIKDVEK